MRLARRGGKVYPLVILAKLFIAGIVNLGTMPAAANAAEVGPRPVRVWPQIWVEPASDDARRVANWVAASGDNGNLPYVIVDKIDAKVFVFHASGQLRGAARALLGAARGDDSSPGIGSRLLALIRPEERTTPAGRFIAALGNDLGENDVLWVDYDTAISLHRVIIGNPGDNRLERLGTNSALNKRISYGCINVPVRFYEDVVHPAFAGTHGIVYILPEQRRLEDVFPLSKPLVRAKR